MHLHLVLTFLLLGQFCFAQDNGHRTVRGGAKGGFWGVQEVDFMPGNDSFGFFLKKGSEDKNFCRLRVKLSCDYGFGSTKALKLKKYTLLIKKISYYSNTDDQGIADGIFMCNSNTPKEKVKLTIDKMQKEFILGSAAQKILFTDKNCK